MFGFGEKARISNAIQMAMRDILRARFASAEDCSHISKTDEGAAWLCTEAMIQFSNALAFAVWSKYGHNRWATLDFFFESVGKSVMDETGNADLFKVIAQGVQRLQSIDGSGPERMRKVFTDSANLVYENDRNVNKDEIIDFLDKRVEIFVNNFGEYFS